MKYGLDSKRKQPASHIAAIMKNPDLDLIAVCDANKKARDLFEEKYGNKIDISADYEKLIEKFIEEKNQFDLIVVATPDSTHAQILQFLLNRLRDTSKHVIIFCEKPLTTGSRSSKQIRNMQKNPNVQIVVNHSRRWSRVWHEAKSLIKKLGNIESAAFYFSTSPENKEIVQIRDGIHIADLINWFGITKKTTINRLRVPYFMYDFYMWGSKGKIEILNNGEVLKFFKIKKSHRYMGFKELELVYRKRIHESILSNIYSEFVSFLKGDISQLSTNIDDGVEAIRVFEKYVYDNKLSKTRER